MGNILTAKVHIEGVRPLLWHRFGPDSIPLEKQEKDGVAGNCPSEWRKTVLATKDGQLYLEPSYIFGTLRDGAKYTTRGRKTLRDVVAATLQVTDDRILTDRHFVGFPNGHSFDIKTAETPSEDPELPVYLDVRSVKNPATKARNVRYRVAASVGWNIIFNIMWDKTMVSRQEMEAIAIDAGRFIGLGDGRNIGFGRFTVESFDVSDLK